MTDLTGKTAVITGSTSGIGLGLARGFAQAGADVVLNGFGDPQEIEGTRAELDAAASGSVTYDGADMTRPDQIEALTGSAIARYGSVDILVNNAGIQQVSPVGDFPRDTWNRIIDINMNSAFHTACAALPAMKSKGWSRIISIASAHGLVASPFKSACVTAKHGVVSTSRTIALEVAGDGITCNAICPGHVLTPLVEAQIPDTAKSRGMTEEEVERDVLLAAQWTKKFVTVEQLAGVVLFFCLNAAENIAGIALPVDGGWTAA